MGVAPAVSLSLVGGSEHESLDRVGVPAFHFLQDPLQLQRPHAPHQHDVYDEVVPGDLKQAPTIIARYAYQAATREDMMPRKPLPSREAASSR